MLQSIAKGTSMIGEAEDLLYPAERIASNIGILYPRSSFYWDEQDVEVPHGIMDCTNTHMFSGPDYLREVFSLRTLSIECVVYERLLTTHSRRCTLSIEPWRRR